MFEKWDANYKTLEARHAPYAAYESKGYNPEYISQALEIQQALASDPNGFIKEVAEHFGISFGQAAAAVEATQEEEFLTPEAQRLAALEARQAAIDDLLSAGFDHADINVLAPEDRVASKLERAA